MPACSICERGEADADVVNTLLHARTKLRDIETQTGLGFRSVSRHAQPSARCPFAFWKWKAARLKSQKTVKLDGRWVVAWPDGTYSAPPAGSHERPHHVTITGCDLRPDDLLILVTFEAPLPARHVRELQPVEPEESVIASELPN